MFQFLINSSIIEASSGIATRTVLGIISSFIMTVIFIPFVIRKINQLKAGQNIRREGPQSHLQKAGRPTMGGIAIMVSVLISSIIWTNLNRYVLLVMAVFVSAGILGFLDDYRKFSQKSSDGVSARFKLIWQIVTGLAIGGYLYYYGHFSTLHVPLLNINLELGLVYIIFAALVVVSSSNAVNLTDGLDGLAIGVIIIVTLCYAGIAYLTGNVILARHVSLNFLLGAGELTVFCGTMLGASLGFLWYNAPPAEIFMGDVGSLSLGAALGAIAIVTKTELLLVIIGGIFVIEVLSVIIQVLVFRKTGRRIFRMSPIHHHFELSGWAETKVVSRFLIITIMLCLFGLTIIGLGTLIK